MLPRSAGVQCDHRRHCRSDTRLFRIPDGTTPANIRYLRGVHRIDQLVTRIIQERRQHGGDRGDLLSMLIAARDDEGQSMTDRQLQDEVITLLLAGVHQSF
jgi:cytochrome P450